jgi:acetyl-CoA C-acetyltransferase
MPFAGGPYNSFTCRASRGWRRCCAKADRGDGSALVSNLSGIFGKQACALFSNSPNPDGYRYEDVTAEVAARDLPVPLDGDYVGPAVIVGYTVVFAGGVASHAIAICDTPSGRRTVVRSDDRALLESMTGEECSAAEWCRWPRCVRVVTAGRRSRP